MRFWFSLSCCLLLVCSWVDYAEPYGEFVEILPHGCINWTAGLLEASGSCPFEDPLAGGGRSDELMAQQARERATRHLMQTMAQVRMDAFRHMAHVMSADPRVAARATEIAINAAVIDEAQQPEDGVEVRVQLAFLGALAQLVLPESIKQVETIKSINRGTPEVVESDFSKLRAMPEASNVYTGLIVDARGTGAGPAMVPLLVDESGKEVYGSVFVSREYAVQQGVCMYVSSLANPDKHPRVGPKPLMVKGLRTLVDRSCDIVISNSDAAKLRDVSANLGFLKQCRVIIIIDP